MADAATHSLFVTARSAVVRNPGRTEPGCEGERFLAIARMHWLSGPAQRGRAYAQDGSLLHLEWVTDVATAIVAGSGSEYITVISGLPARQSVTSPDTRTSPSKNLVASCSCPYGSRSRDWCKHAIALSYAIAAVLDGDVDDQTGSLGLAAARTLDHATLAAGVAALAVEPDWSTFGADAHFERSRQWLALPPVVGRELAAHLEGGRSG